MKKFLCMLLAVLLVMAIAMPAALAEGTSGTPAATGTAALFAGGTGTKDDPFQITTAAQLASVKGAVDEDPSYCFKVMNMINMSGVAFTPIADKYIPFEGTFDGNNMNIANLTVKEDGEGWTTALFRASEGMIKSVRLVNAKIYNTNKVRGFAAGICGWNEGTIADCTVYGTIASYASTSYGLAGGICCVNRGYIKACTNNARVRSYMTAYTYCGGIAALNSYDSDTNGAAKLDGCTNKGYISGGKAGGVVGQNEGGYIYNCKNRNKVKADKFYAGGIAATNVKSEGRAARVQSCYDYSAAISGRFKGSIVGYNQTGSKVYKSNKAAKIVKIGKIGAGFKVLV